MQSTEECTIILSKLLLDEIRKFQKFISENSNTTWELGDVIALLLRYAINDLDKVSNAHLETIEYYFGQKLNLLDEIYLNTVKSLYTSDSLCTV